MVGVRKVFHVTQITTISTARWSWLLNELEAEEF
jgi:hypothetical protein